MNYTRVLVYFKEKRKVFLNTTSVIILRGDCMSDDFKESVQGVKTFFVVPDLSLFPEEFLKSFFLKGYETYFLHDDPYCPLETKIHTLFSVFPQVILFFNIDRPVQGIDWPVFIDRLQEQ